MHGWYELEIRKSGIDDLYGFDSKPSSNTPSQNNDVQDGPLVINTIPVQSPVQIPQYISVVETPIILKELTPES